MRRPESFNTDHRCSNPRRLRGQRLPSPGARRPTRVWTDPHQVQGAGAIERVPIQTQPFRGPRTSGDPRELRLGLAAPERSSVKGTA